jgi:hypothetical protein
MDSDLVDLIEIYLQEQSMTQDNIGDDSTDLNQNIVETYDTRQYWR